MALFIGVHVAENDLTLLVYRKFAVANSLVAQRRYFELVKIFVVTLNARGK